MDRVSASDRGSQDRAERGPREPTIDTEDKPEVLVLGGGGAKGAVVLGALEALRQAKHLDKVHSIVGVSVGAIIGLLLCCGFDPFEITTLALDTNIFQDISSINLLDIPRHAGLLSSQSIQNKLDGCMIQKFGKVLTLHQLYLATGKTLVCVAVNITRCQTEYLSATTEPNTLCTEAVLLSMNIPILFHRRWHNGCVYIDGAFGNPYPINHLDDGKTPILGISIVTVGECDDALYVHRIIDAPMAEIKRWIIEHASPLCKHLTIETTVADTTGLFVTLSSKAQMIVTGYMATTTYLKTM